MAKELTDGQIDDLESNEDISAEQAESFRKDKTAIPETEEESAPLSRERSQVKQEEFKTDDLTDNFSDVKLPEFQLQETPQVQLPQMTVPDTGQATYANLATTPLVLNPGLVNQPLETQQVGGEIITPQVQINQAQAEADRLYRENNPQSPESASLGSVADVGPEEYFGRGLGGGVPRDTVVPETDNIEPQAIQRSEVTEEEPELVPEFTSEDNAETMRLADAHAQKLANEQALVEQRYQAAKAPWDAKTKALQIELEAVASRKIDPNRVWANRSTASRIFAIIGASLAAVGNSGSNPVLNALQHEIDNDIKAQISDRQSELTSLQTRVASVGKQARLSQEEYESLRKPAVTAMYQSAASTMSMVATLKSRQGGFAPDSAEAQKLNGLIATFEKQAADKFNAVQSEIVASKNTVSVSDAAIMASDIPNHLKVQDMTNQQKDRWISLIGQFANSPGDAKTIKSPETTQQLSALGALNELMELGKGKMTPETIVKANVLRTMIQGMVRTMIIGGGAISAPEWKILDKAIPDVLTPGSYLPLQRAKLEVTIKAIRTMLQDKFTTAGLDFNKVKNLRAVTDSKDIKSFSRDK